MGGIMLVAAITALFWHALVFKILWGWFFVSIFGLPSLGLAEAIGIMATLSLFTFRYIKKEEDKEESIRRILQAFFMPLVCLFVGGIVYWFI